MVINAPPALCRQIHNPDQTKHITKAEEQSSGTKRDDKNAPRIEAPGVDTFSESSSSPRLHLSGGSPIVADGSINAAQKETSASSSEELPNRASCPSALKLLQNELEKAEQRKVHPHVAADLINRLRRLGPMAHSAPGCTPAATNDELLSGISDADLKAWYHAQGLNPEEVSRLRKAAFVSGLANPAGSFLNNAMQYIGAPWMTYFTKNPWGGTGLGLVTAAIAAPMNAGQQSAVVLLCDLIRERGGPVIVPDKKNINDKHWLTDLSKDLELHVNQFAAQYDQLSRTMARLELNIPGIEADALKSKLENIGHLDLQELREQAQRLLDAEQKLHETQRDFLMTQGIHERHWKGNRWQSIPRTLRAPTAGLVGLVNKAGAARMLAPALQTAGSLVLTATQHLASGFDEKARQDHMSKLNLLYGDVFTKEGHDNLACGKPIRAADIDEGKLRGLIRWPVQSLVKRVSSELNRQIAILEKIRASPIPGAPSDEASPSRPDYLVFPCTASLPADDLASQIAKDGEALSQLKEDAKNLSELKLSKLHPNGLAEMLLLSSETSILSPQSWRDLVAKYTAREFSAQTAQRIGQMFHLGICGSAASSVIGKVISAAKGGSRNMSRSQIVGISALSGVMAGVGALSQHVAISVKNHRRDNVSDIGAKKQLVRGALGGANEMLAQRAGVKASRAMNSMLGQKQIKDSLAFSKGLQAEYGETELPEKKSVELSLKEAAGQLNPAHVSPLGNGRIVIQMDE